MANQPLNLTLLGLTKLVTKVIVGNPYLGGLFVAAEITDMRIAGGHCYMELIDKNPAGQTVAKMRAMIWAKNVPAIFGKFKQATGSNLASGMKVQLWGGVTHHEQHGLSFNITDINPAYTQGELERQRQEILNRLRAEGVLDCNKSLQVPIAPQRIAVVSAAGAAGYGDFINQLESSPEKFVFYPHLWPAVMQGERTAPSVIAALDGILRTRRLWDAVVIIRGGGSTSDMNGFDNLELARKVATFPLPVIIGIGHERDRNVLDEIGCVRCKTPTAVAGYLIDCLRRALSQAVTMTQEVARYSADRVAGEQRMVSALEATVPSAAVNILHRTSMQLQQYATLIPTAVQARAATENGRLSLIASNLDMQSSHILERHRQALSQTVVLLSDAIPRQTDSASRKLQTLGEVIEALSPANTLRRGYSITRVRGRAVTDPSQVSSGSVMEITLAGGAMAAVKK